MLPLLPRVAEGVLGAAIVAVVLNDLFNGVVVPRPTFKRLSPATVLLKTSWWAWRAIGNRVQNSPRREGFLGIYAPLALIALLATWISGEVLGFGLILHALGDQFSRPPGFGDALYAAGSAQQTLGTGDLAATGPAARLVFVLSAMLGLGTVALVITLLFSLYAHFQTREALVVTLDARAGAPPSGVTLLETFQQFQMTDGLGGLFAEWEQWSARVLDSHIAYPILAFFRSSHDNESWVAALGAVLDAATLVVSTVQDVPRGPAWMMVEIGSHVVEDMGHWLNVDGGDDVGVERAEYDEARARLTATGYSLGAADADWETFAKIRRRYAVSLNALARHWAIPPSQWIGDRTILRRRHNP